MNDFFFFFGLKYWNGFLCSVWTKDSYSKSGCFSRKRRADQSPESGTSRREPGASSPILPLSGKRSVFIVTMFQHCPCPSFLNEKIPERDTGVPGSVQPGQSRQEEWIMALILFPGDSKLNPFLRHFIFTISRKLEVAWKNHGLWTKWKTRAITLVILPIYTSLKIIRIKGPSSNCVTEFRVKLMMIWACFCGLTALTLHAFPNGF